MNRRNFLKNSAISGLTLSGLPILDTLNNSAHAAVAPRDFKTLVCVYLDGGNDSFNMLVPNTSTEYRAYQQSRQAFALEQSDLQLISPNGLGTNSFGLHPNMPGIKQMFDNSEASFIANAGPLIRATTKSDIVNETADLPTRLGSHSEGRSYWKSDHDNSPNTTKDGIGGRLASEFINNGVLPINISSGSGYDLFLAHAQSNFYDVSRSGVIKMFDYDLSRSTYNRAPSIARRAAQAKLNELASSDPNLFIQHAGDLFAEGLDLNVRIQSLLENIPPSTVDFPVTNIGRHLKNAAALISIRQQLNMNRQIIFVRVSGFDTHSGQESAHPRLMQELNDALTAFNSELKQTDEYSSVVPYTASDFGRTLTNNGSGTDHAWGGNQILMGGAIKGGELFGSYPELRLDGPEDYNGDGRFIPSTSITQIGTTLARWFGVPDNRLSTVFPNITNFRGAEDLGYFRT